jgi:hypothetical protein
MEVAFGQFFTIHQLTFNKKNQREFLKEYVLGLA